MSECGHGIADEARELASRAAAYIQEHFPVHEDHDRAGDAAPTAERPGAGGRGAAETEPPVTGHAGGATGGLDDDDVYGSVFSRNEGGAEAPMSSAMTPAEGRTDGVGVPADKGADEAPDKAAEEAPHELDVHRWSARDGVDCHTIYTEKLAELDDPDRGIHVERELPVRLGDAENGWGREGRVDALINENVIDIKTDQMHEWSPEKAARMGSEYGKQVSEYVNSVDTPDDAKGHLVMLGRETPDTALRSEIRAAFSDAAAQHGVNVLYIEHDEDADPDALKDRCRQEFLDK